MGGRKAKRAVVVNGEVTLPLYTGSGRGPLEVSRSSLPSVLHSDHSNDKTEMVEDFIPQTFRMFLGYSHSFD